MLNNFIERLYCEMYSKLVILATAKIDDISLAEDLVQDVFAEALRQEEKLKSYDVPEAWLMQTLKYKVLNFQRFQQREHQKMRSLEELFISGQEVTGIPLSCFEGIDVKELLHQIRQCLNGEEFYLLRRVALEGARYEQTAMELHISTANCYKRLSRIRQKLAKAFPEYAPKRNTKKEKELIVWKCAKKRRSTERC